MGKNRGTNLKNWKSPQVVGQHQPPKESLHIQAADQQALKDGLLEASEQSLQPQKLESIKEESTTGSEQLKRDSIPESQEVKQAETK